MSAPKTSLSAREMIALNRPLVIGHRGYSGVAPENTLPSFKLALEAGADLVELDYQQSKDGVLVVIHDEILDRTTDACERWGRTGIKVADTSAAEIRTLDAGRWRDGKFAEARVPALGEALDLIVGSGGTALIEQKSGDAAACAGLLRDWGQASKTMVISFDWTFLRELHEVDSGQVLGALGPPEHSAKGSEASNRQLSEFWLDELAKTGANAVVWSKETPVEAIRLAHRRGLRVWIYTIDDPKLALELVSRGVDGIITNRISVIQDALKTVGGVRRPA